MRGAELGTEVPLEASTKESLLYSFSVFNWGGDVGELT